MFIELDGEKEEFTKTSNSVYWYKPIEDKEKEENEKNDMMQNHIKNYPDDFLKLDSKSPDILIEYIGILSSESNKGTENLIKSIKKERERFDDRYKF